MSKQNLSSLFSVSVLLTDWLLPGLKPVRLQFEGLMRQALVMCPLLLRRGYIYTKCAIFYTKYHIFYAKCFLCTTKTLSANTKHLNITIGKKKKIKNKWAMSQYSDYFRSALSPWQPVLPSTSVTDWLLPGLMDRRPPSVSRTGIGLYTGHGLQWWKTPKI